MSDTRFYILDTGLGKTDPYVIVDENEKVLAASYEQNGEHNKAGLLRLTSEIATLRAQLVEAREANERLAMRINWIRINHNDAVALRFALEATDKEIDGVKHLITERD